LIITTTATTAIYTLSLHDALPISHGAFDLAAGGDALTRFQAEGAQLGSECVERGAAETAETNRSGDIHQSRIARRPRESRSLRRSEEHTSELQSRENLVCRLLLEK